MDFGDLMEYGDDVIAPPKAQEEDTDEGTDTKGVSEENEDDLNLDINEVMSGESKEGEEKEDNKGDEDEEEHEEQEDDDKESSPDSSSKETKKKDDDTSGVPFTLVFARAQLEQGNISELNEEELQKIIEEEGEGAAMSYLFQSEVEANRQEYLKQYEQDAEELKEYMELKDAGVDTETAKRLVGDLASFNKITEDQLESEDAEDLRRAVITQNYKNSTKFSDTKIKKLVDNAISLGDDMDEAKEALVSIKEYNKELIQQEKEQLLNQQKSFEEQHKKQIQTVKDSIEKLDEIMPGHKINKQTKKKIEDMMLKPVGQDKAGNQVNQIWKKRMDNPIDFDMKLAYLLSTGYFDGKTDKLVKRERSKAVEDLEKHIKNSSSNELKGKSSMNRGDSDDKERDAIESMRKAFNM